MDNSDPHRGQPVQRRGPEATAARLTVILVHGRNAAAANILATASEIGMPADVALVAPQAAGNTWYPLSFLSEIEKNEPFLSSALGVLEQVVDDLEGRGIPASRIALLGFSQGACLTLEFAARHARRYAAIVGLSGGLIGPPGTPRTYPGAFDDTPIFLGCSDVDAHVPLERVRESADVFRRMGAAVDMRIYPQMGHLVNRDEMDAVQALLRRRE
jgi:predicted esterase